MSNMQIPNHAEQHGFGGPDQAGTGYYEYKLFGDDEAVATGDSKWILVLPSMLRDSKLVEAQAYVTTVGSSDTVVQVRNEDNGNVDMLSTPITIDSSKVSSYSSVSPRVIDLANNHSNLEDRIHTDVDSAGAGSKGLTIILIFQRAS